MNHMKICKAEDGEKPLCISVPLFGYSSKGLTFIYRFLLEGFVTEWVIPINLMTRASQSLEN